MLEKKNLIINCDICDTRKINEENYSVFEKIIVNCDITIVSDRSKGAINKLPITINNNTVIEMSDDMNVNIKSVDGTYEITENMVSDTRTVLVVNGELILGRNTENALKCYEKILVNGTVKYPKSVEGYMGSLTINGETVSYPDDCILLNDRFMVDRFFPMRAKKNTSYFSNGTIFIDENANTNILAENAVNLFSKNIVFHENKINDIIAITDEKINYVVVPDGLSIITDSCILDNELVKKHGTSLFVYGDLIFGNDIPKVERLFVSGKIILKKEQKAELDNINAEYGSIEFADNSNVIMNVVKAYVNENLLASVDDGVIVMNVAEVKISDDVKEEQIIGCLKLRNCGRVICSDNQKSAVSVVSENVGIIKSDNDEKKPDDELIEMLINPDMTKMVNSDEYVM